MWVASWEAPPPRWLYFNSPKTFRGMPAYPWSFRLRSYPAEPGARLRSLELRNASQSRLPSGLLQTQSSACFHDRGGLTSACSSRGRALSAAAAAPDTGNEVARRLPRAPSQLMRHSLDRSAPNTGATMNTPEAPVRVPAWAPPSYHEIAQAQAESARLAPEADQSTGRALRRAAIGFGASAVLALAAAGVQYSLNHGGPIPGNVVLRAWHVASPFVLGLALAAGFSAWRSKVSRLLTWTTLAGAVAPIFLQRFDLPSPNRVGMLVTLGIVWLAGSLWLWRSGRDHDGTAV